MAFYYLFFGKVVAFIDFFFLPLPLTSGLQSMLNVVKVSSLSTEAQHACRRRNWSSSRAWCGRLNSGRLALFLSLWHCIPGLRGTSTDANRRQGEASLRALRRRRCSGPGHRASELRLLLALACFRLALLPAKSRDERFRLLFFFFVGDSPNLR